MSQNEITEERKNQSNNMIEALYTMLIGETLNVNNVHQYTRVPSGWSLTTIGAHNIASIFIPYSFDEMPRWINDANSMGFFDKTVIEGSDNDDLPESN